MNNNNQVVLKHDHDLFFTQQSELKKQRGSFIEIAKSEVSN